MKIDRSFVATITEHGQFPPIVRGMLELGRVLQLEVIAEGVELPCQRDRLCDAHCDFAQGYLFAPPLDQAGAEALLVQLERADLADPSGVIHLSGAMFPTSESVYDHDPNRVASRVRRQSILRPVVLTGVMTRT